MRTTPALPGEYADYLEAHGWERKNTGSCDAILFLKKDLRLFVKGDVIDLFIEDPFADGRPKFELLFSFTGWSSLGFLAWTFLMHIIGAVSLRSFLTKVKQEVTHGVPPFEDLMKHFRIHDHKGVPEAY